MATGITSYASFDLFWSLRVPGPSTLALGAREAEAAKAGKGKAPSFIHRAL